MDNFKFRRPSFSGFTAAKQEPLIVVEESNQNEAQLTQTQQSSLDTDSPVNPYLLSPWRDPRETRKHSLPSQQVTEGITASQVRRLSERGGEGSGPTPRETAFLATLSQAPAPSGRRHSIVTISKVPSTLFGRSRRESVAAFPVPNSTRVLGSRRESGSSIGPPATDRLGSLHNLQLDIMDDIVQSRKARMKLWTTSSEKVCEVQTVDESGTSKSNRYTNRRYSDYAAAASTSAFGTVTGTKATTPLQRRPSEVPIRSPGSTRSRKKSIFLGSELKVGSILSNLTSSAMEINKFSGNESVTTKPKASSSSSFLDPNVGRSTRSNSFDVSILQNAKQFISETEDKSSAALSGWFAKRHQPISKKKTCRSKSTSMALSKDMLEKLQKKDCKEVKKRSRSKHKGSMVDPHYIGNAIEGFLRKSAMSVTSSSKGAIPKDKKKSSNSSTNRGWFGKNNEDDSKDSSLCSTLKDLFVK